MKIKFTLPPDKGPDSPYARLWDVQNRRPFYRVLFERVLGGCFDVKDPLARRAAYFPHRPDEMDDLGDEVYGVVFQLTGISRAQRSSELFQEAYRHACALVVDFVKANVLRGTKVQVMVQFALDAQVEIEPGDYGALIDGYETEITGEYDQPATT